MPASRRDLRSLHAQSLPKAAPPPDPSASTLVAALHNAVAGREDGRSRLDQAVCEYIAHLKADGLFAEQAIVRVKQAINHAGLHRDGTSVEDMIDRVITLGIREYYKTQ